MKCISFSRLVAVTSENGAIFFRLLFWFVNRIWNLGGNDVQTEFQKRSANYIRADINLIAMAAHCSARETAIITNIFHSEGGLN